MRELLLLLLVAATDAEDWQPISPALTFHTQFIKTRDRFPAASHPATKIINRPGFGRPSKKPHSSDEEVCSVYKVSMNQELSFQYVEYQKPLPDLKEFTLCMWTKFHNHSDDHPLFSYAVGDSSKEILAWISNTDQASYFSLAIAGHTFFRLNYPLKLNTWYHSCQSWNGKTGEWQIWVNSERVGRGFHNRLVGHVIKGGGLAISGQDQSQLYKDNLDTTSGKIGKGMMGEITQLQLYHVALTAGKAHKDHKHHHAHHFRHDGTPLEPTQPPQPDPPATEPVPIGNGNFFIGGQLMRPQNLNLAAQPQTVQAELPNGLKIQQQYINGQLTNRIVAEQLLNSKYPAVQGQFPSAPAVQFSSSQFPSAPSQQPQQFSNPQIQYSSQNGPSLPQIQYSQSQSSTFSQSPSFQSLGPSKPTTLVLSSSLANPANVQYIEDTAPAHSLFRRDSVKRDKRDNPEKEDTEVGKKNKRGLVELSDGSVVDEALLGANSQVDQVLLQQSILDGLAGFDGNLPIQNIQKEKAEEREPAEAEVRAVQEVCSGCAPEPFKKALVLSWKSTSKKLYSGAHFYKGLPICKAF